jgi:rod shape-determining protein MreC
MLRDRYARRRLIIFVVLMTMSVGLIAVSGSGPAQELRNGVRFAIAPVQDTLSDSTRSVTSVVGAITEVDTLRRENDELTTTVDRLSDQLAVMESLRAENKKLNKVLGTKDTLTDRGIKTVAARVSARQFTQFERLVTIDRGSESGVRTDAPVLSEGGALLGRVLDVGEGWADVRLISDPNSLVAGWVRRGQASGEVIGRLSAPLAMTEIPRTQKIAENELVVTYGIKLRGGYQSVYPKGIPIGRVVDILEEPQQVLKTALIVPQADLEHFEYVLVQTNFKPPKRSGSDESSD